MSGLIGIWNFDGRPVDSRLLRRMTDNIAHRGPDGSGVWADGPVGLGHVMLHTTPESLGEHQPMTDETDLLHLTFDGRVDNRQVLAAALKARGLTLRTDTDAELVLQAYRCWGEECPQHILGDFAFAIWDSRKRQLFCARDPIGIRPFYYYRDDRVIVFASELRPLFEHPAVRRKPNEGMIAEYLAAEVTSREETLYRSIFRLPPAHVLVVSLGRVRISRYWAPDLRKELRYRRDEDYAEHCSTIFREAVRCRLRCQGPVGSDLSGGLDSSSVVGMAQSLFRQGTIPDRGFETFSVTFPGLPCDENDYIADVVRLWGLKSTRLPPQYVDPDLVPDQIRHHLDFPDYPNQTMSDPLSAVARDKRISVMLTGLGGDDWFGQDFPPYADLFRTGRWLELLRALRDDADGSGLCQSLKEFLSPLLPWSARRVYRWACRANGIPPWIDKRFARQTDLAERLHPLPEDQPFSSYAQRDLIRTARSGFFILSHEMTERSASGFSIELRHPFHDRRFIEFVLSLPQNQRQRGALGKFVLRQAMQTRLPNSVRQRTTKAEFSHTLAEALCTEAAGRRLRSLSIASLEWVEGDRVRHMHQELARLYRQGDDRYQSHVWPLWMILGIDLWFNTAILCQEATQPAAPPRLQPAGAYV